MIIVGDSGSSTTNWVLINGKEVINEFTTAGFNPYYYGADVLVNSIEQGFGPEVNKEAIDAVYYYASGCSTTHNRNIVSDALSQVFVNAQLSIDHDLFGAARALLHDNSGIACILGTGSNSCRWDGKAITEQAPSLGYLLGDEGSGTFMGKLFITGLLRGEAGVEMSQLFEESYHMKLADVLVRLYQQDMPNKFLAELSKFIKTHENHSYCQTVVQQSMDWFFKYFIEIYEGYTDESVAFTGSVAHYFSEQLSQVMGSHGIRNIKIIQKPIDGLTIYHLNQ